MVRQKGLALITALFVVSLATIMAVTMVSRQQFDIRRSENIFSSEQALLYHVAIEDHATSLLEENWDNLKFLTLEEFNKVKAIIGLGYKEPIDGGMLEVSFELTPQSLFNLNLLIDEKGKANKDAINQFKRILSHFELNTDLADVVVDWIDSDIDVRFPGGAEDGYYLGLQPPYRVSNQPMVSISELKMLNGFSKEVLDKLTPFVTVLPRDMALNINWAEQELLQSLHNDIDDVMAETIKAYRSDKAFEKNDDLSQVQGMSKINIPQGLITVTSHAFKVKSTIRIGRLIKRYSSLIRYNGSGRAVLLYREQERLI